MTLFWLVKLNGKTEFEWGTFILKFAVLLSSEKIQPYFCSTLFFFLISLQVINHVHHKHFSTMTLVQLFLHTFGSLFCTLAFFFLEGCWKSGPVYLFPLLFSPCALCSLSSSDLWLSELWLWLVCIISSLSLLSIFSSRLLWTPTPPAGDHTKSSAVTSQVQTVQRFKSADKRRWNVRMQQWTDERIDSPLPPACMGWSVALCLAGYGWPFCVRLWRAEWLLFILTASTFMTQKEGDEIQATFICSLENKPGSVAYSIQLLDPTKDYITNTTSASSFPTQHWPDLSLYRINLISDHLNPSLKTTIHS